MPSDAPEECKTETVEGTGGVCQQEFHWRCIYEVTTDPPSDTTPTVPSITEPSNGITPETTVYTEYPQAPQISVLTTSPHNSLRNILDEWENNINNPLAELHKAIHSEEQETEPPSCDTSDPNAPCVTCEGVESSRMIRAQELHLNALRNLNAGSSLSELQSVKSDLEEAIDLYVVAGESPNERCLAYLERGSAYLAISRVGLAIYESGGNSEGSVTGKHNAISEYEFIIESCDDSLIKSKAHTNLALALIDDVSEANKIGLRYPSNGLERALRLSAEAVKNDPDNEEAKAVLKAVRLSLLSSIDQRLGENINDIIDSDIINTREPELDLWYALNVYWETWTDVFDILRETGDEILSIVARYRPNRSDLQASWYDSLWDQKLGVAQIVNFEGNGGDLNRYYELVDNPLEQRDYISEIYGDNPSEVSRIRDLMNRAIRNNIDVNFVARYGDDDLRDSRNSRGEFTLEDKFGYEASPFLVFPTESAYYGNVKFKFAWYDKISNEINFVNAGLILAPGASCVRGARSIAEGVSAKTIWRLPGLRNWGSTAGTRAAGNVVAFGAGIAGEEGLVAVGVPRPLAIFAGGLVVFSPQGMATRAIFGEVIEEIPDEVMRKVVGKGRSITPEIRETVENIAHLDEATVLRKTGLTQVEYHEVLEKTIKKGKIKISISEPLIDEPLDEIISIRRLDPSNPISTSGSNKISSGNIEELFKHQYKEGTHGAKAIAYIDQTGETHVRFWKTGEGRVGINVHHRDGLADLVEQEGKTFERLSDDLESEELLELAIESQEAAETISTVRNQNVFSDDLLTRSQGFQLTRGADGKVKFLDVDSSVTATQISRDIPMDAKELSEMISNIHNSISPELRGYRNIRVMNLGQIKLNGQLNLPDGLNAIDLIE